MSVVTSTSESSFLTNNLVQSVWNDYITKKPCFLDHVSLHIKELPSVGGAGTFQYVLPNYLPAVVTATADAISPTLTPYSSVFQSVNWGSNNIRVARYAISQFDMSLYLTSAAYQMSFVSGMLTKVLAQFEIDFATQLQSTNIWPTILHSLPKTRASAMATNSFAIVSAFWYDSMFAPTPIRRPPLVFIPDTEDLGGYSLHICSQYARYLGLQSPRLACDTAVMAAIGTECNAASSTTSLIGGWQYNSAGQGSISNGYLTAYSLPSLAMANQQTNSALATRSWTQGVMFFISGITNNGDGTSAVSLTVSTKAANLTAIAGSFPVVMPFVLSTKRYSPISKVVASMDNFATFNGATDVITGVLVQGGTIVITVDNAQLAVVEALYANYAQTVPSSLPVAFANPAAALSVHPLFGLTVSTPWRPGDFFATVTSAAFQCPRTASVLVHKSYLYPKDGANIFAVKQRKTGGGVEAETHIVSGDTPLMMFERGDASLGVNNITAQGIMPMAITPQLGGVYLSCSTVGSQYVIPV